MVLKSVTNIEIPIVNDRKPRLPTKYSCVDCSRRAARQPMKRSAAGVKHDDEPVDRVHGAAARAAGVRGLRDRWARRGEHQSRDDPQAEVFHGKTPAATKPVMRSPLGHRAHPWRTA